MTLYTNLTSPYARLVRVAVVEKGLSDRVREEVIDPWCGDPEFLRANVHERVPALVTACGFGLAESSLILEWLEHIAPDPSLYPKGRLGSVLQRAASAIGAIDIMAAIVISRKSAPAFDEHIVGRKRFRTLQAALNRLETDPPADFGEGPDISAIATAVALDYAIFRFPHLDIFGSRPRLRSWRHAQAGRASLEGTMPREPVSSSAQP